MSEVRKHKFLNRAKFCKNLILKTQHPYESFNRFGLRNAICEYLEEHIGVFNDLLEVSLTQILLLQNFVVNLYILASFFRQICLDLPVPSDLYEVH